jgi:hypothetical protein
VIEIAEIFEEQVRYLLGEGKAVRVKSEPVELQPDLAIKP